MGTRCQVRVYAGTGTQPWDSVTLYHHYDGYPEHMLPLIWSAHEQFAQSGLLGDAGHVAAFLCAVNPLEFEPEAGHELHGDIEYYYKLYVPSWDIIIYGYDGELEGDPEIELPVIQERAPLRNLLKYLGSRKDWRPS